MGLSLGRRGEETDRRGGEGLSLRHFKNYHGDDSATGCKNVVNFHAATQKITRVKCTIDSAAQPQFDDRPSFGTLAFRIRLESGA